MLASPPLAAAKAPTPESCNKRRRLAFRIIIRSPQTFYLDTFCQTKS
jgi:hypothetical protein